MLLDLLDVHQIEFDSEREGDAPSLLITLSPLLLEEAEDVEVDMQLEMPTLKILDKHGIHGSYKFMYPNLIEITNKTLNQLVNDTNAIQ